MEPVANVLFKGAPGLAYFLDLDGTLVPIVPHPDQARLDPTARVALQDLVAASRGAVALVSGRTIAEVDRMVRPLHLPVAGVHGAERRDASGHYHPLPTVPPAVMAATRDRLQAVTAACPGTFLEDKGIALAVHFRQAPKHGERIRATLSELVAATGGRLALQAGKCVYELRPAHCDKGQALSAFMAEAPFAGRTPVYLGDDLTDEHAFVAANALGGYSIKVGPGHTRARWYLPDQPAVIDWLLGVRPATAAKGDSSSERSQSGLNR